MADVQLLKNEELKLKLKPHMLSFTHLYIIFLVLVIWGGLTYVFFAQGVWETLSEVEGIGGGIDWLADTTGGSGEVAIATFIWAIVLFVCGFLARHFSIEAGGTKVFFFYMFIILVGIGVESWYGRKEGAKALEDLYVGFLPGLTIGFGVAGLVLTDWYRRSFTYYITNLRILLTNDFLLTKDERIIRHNHIEDLKLEQGMIGRIFDFGNVNPLTGSGIGTGSDDSIAVVGAGKNVEGVNLSAAGGSKRSVTKARASPTDTLYGVPDPSKVRTLISQYIEDSTGVEHLKRIEDLLEKQAKAGVKKDEE